VIPVRTLANTVLTDSYVIAIDRTSAHANDTPPCLATIVLKHERIPQVTYRRRYQGGVNAIALGAPRCLHGTTINLAAHYQFPPIVLASPKLHGPHRPLAGCTGVSPQFMHVLVQSGRFSGSNVCRGTFLNGLVSAL
jgi:hypothetical protein